MDRLSSLIAAAAAVGLLGLACSESGSSSAPSRERVNAVKAEPATAVDTAAMCDRSYAPAAAPAFRWPELTGPTPPAPARSWRWINVWATWCEPCVEELPRLTSWRSRLVQAGIAVELSLVSADESDDEIKEFRRAHPGNPDSARMAEPDEVAGWIEAMGVKGATLPVHLFVNPAGKVRCVRASAVEESDYAAVKSLLGGS